MFNFSGFRPYSLVGASDRVIKKQQQKNIWVTVLLLFSNNEFSLSSRRVENMTLTVIYCLPLKIISILK